jgi:zinc transporter
MISRMSDALNKRMYVLSLIAAIFLPLGFLTGLLGINVGGIPGADNPMAFTIFVVFLIIIVLFQIVLFRWRKWF